MWNRIRGHDGELKNFGICQYYTVEGMLKCLRLLDGVVIEDGYDLKVIIF